MQPTRRAFLTSALSFLATPAIIRPGILMPVRPRSLVQLISATPNIQQVVNRTGLLTMNQITREAVRLWQNSNAFVENAEYEWPGLFAAGQPSISRSIRIRLPTGA
jgi:hypothetical protein